MLCQILGLLVLDNEGGRIAVKYTPGTEHPELKDHASQTAFEANLIQRSNRLAGRSEVEVVMNGEILALFRSVNDVCLFVLAEPHENAFILLDVANELFAVLNNITNAQVGKRQLFEHLDVVFLTLDEILDRGLIFEVDASMTTSRIRMVEGGDGLPEPTAFNQALASAKDNIMRSFLSGTG